MLDGVDDIEWSALTAWGNPTTVPGLLRALAVAERPDALELLDELRSVLTHQGEPSECEVFAVPFLIELAEAPSTSCRDAILASLKVTALFTHFVDVFGIRSDDWGGDDWSFAADAAGPASTWLAEGRLWKRGLATDDLDELRYLAVADQWRRIGALLDDEDPVVRIRVVEVLASLGTLADDILPVLRQRLGIEGDPRVRANLCAGAGELGLCIVESDKPGVARQLLGVTGADTDDVVRMVGATAAALVAPSVVPPSVRDDFIERYERHGDEWQRIRLGLWPGPLSGLWKAWEQVHAEGRTS